MRYLSGLLLLVVALSVAVPASAAGQAEATPPAWATGAPVTAGDWTFVADVERHDSYYAERLGQMFEPEGVFLIVGVQITYNGAAPYDLGREFISSAYRLAVDGEIVRQAQDAFAAFEVEQTYLKDQPFLSVRGAGTLDQGMTVYERFIFDVPPEATDLALVPGTPAPDGLEVPLPEPVDVASREEWDLEVTGASYHELLGPPMTTPNVYEPEGIYLVVDVRLMRLVDEEAPIYGSWFTLELSDGETVSLAHGESFALGLPYQVDGRASKEFGLVFDVPAILDGASLVTTPGTPLTARIPLETTVAPTPTPTIAPTMTPTPTPSAPGAIRVVTGEEAGVLPPDASGAVEIIFDTSGSMLALMGDRLRIDVATEVLTDVLTVHLPPGTQTAVRVFGSVPGSCETGLVIPLGPLDPDQAVAIVGGIQVINEVRTPLGASLEAARDDLASIDGPKLIVLITDGEETCGGEPGTVIGAMVADGIDVRVNIVGFAIDDAAIEESLAIWAAQGGGQYFSASDAGALGDSVRQALQPSFDVRDSDGFTFGSGIVNGDAVEVPAGRYRVVINTEPPVTIDNVVVEPGETREVAPDEDGAREAVS